MKKDQKIYVTEGGVRFRKPSEAPDGIENMTEGQEVIFVDGPWFRVTKDGKTGWVYADYLSETNSNHTQEPTLEQAISFVKGLPNLFDSPVTTAIRRIINDEFHGGNDYLNCTEYVQYRLKTKLGIDIQWPVKSGRHGGKWWKVFRDAGLYQILTEPQANCAMCFTAGISQDAETNEIGHVAFVEEVMPDGSVKVSEANWPPAGQKPQGQYNERTIPKEKWLNQYQTKFVSFV